MVDFKIEFLVADDRSSLVSRAPPKSLHGYEANSTPIKGLGWYIY